MKVVLIAWSYPPDKQVGARRAQRLARTFRRAGFEVEVVVARLPGEQDGSRPMEEGIRVHPVRSMPHPRDFYRWLKHRFSLPGRNSSASTTPPAESAPVSTSQRLPWWKRALLSLTSVPDHLQGFIFPAFACALPLARGADLIYTTSPPHSDHLVGWLLKTFTGVRWVAEFRDPWNGGAESPSRIQTRASNALNLWLERRSLRAADHVVGVSTGICDLLRGRLGNPDGGRVILALNGIERIEPAGGSREEEGPFRVAYVGNVYLGRDPRPFLSAVGATRRRLNLGPEDLRIDFAGQCSNFHGISVERFVEEVGISDIVHFHGWIPHAQGQQLLQDADLLLLLAQGQPIQIPNKLFEYLGMRKPILAFVDAEGESAHILRQVGGHYLVTRDEPVEIEGMIAAALSPDPEGHSAADEKVLQELMAERQMEHLLRSLSFSPDGLAPGGR